MTTTLNSYKRGDGKQPHGNRPRCAECDTDIHLGGESPAIPGPQPASPAAFRCSGCGVSGVFETTSDHLVAFPAPPAPPQELVRDGTYFHCGEPMAPPGPQVEALLRTFPAQDQPGSLDSLAAYLATKVLRCRCGFQMEVPR